MQSLFFFVSHTAVVRFTHITPKSIQVNGMGAVSDRSVRCFRAVTCTPAKRSLPYRHLPSRLGNNSNLVVFISSPTLTVPPEQSRDKDLQTQLFKKKKSQAPTLLPIFALLPCASWSHDILYVKSAL